LGAEQEQYSSESTEKAGLRSEVEKWRRS